MKSVVSDAAVTKLAEATEGRSPREAMLKNAANEIVFAVVGHAGSGTSTVAKALHQVLSVPALGYDVDILSAREVISGWANSHSLEVPNAVTSKLKGVELLQDRGDDMRKQTDDFTSVARALISKVRTTRAQKTGIKEVGDGPVAPDGKPRAYILDSIRHPAEVELLRHVYQDAFILIGIVCEEEKRTLRLTQKYPDAGVDSVRKFMRRDAKDSAPHGQRVAEAFYLADFFLDNSVERFLPDTTENPNWDINEKLGRLIRIVTHSEIVRPETAETAMNHAAGAAMRSACLSRQVGAALTDPNGNVIATGSNEVPRAGGGVYGEVYFDEPDHRCAFRKLPPGVRPYCSNTTEQNALVDKLIEQVPELKNADAIRKLALKEEIKRSGIGDLIEFSRAVHAEMDALLSAGREGISTVGGRLYVTTFPCHYCARHIVTAGVDEVQFIEPYPKSRAAGLHGDAIAQELVGWTPPSRGGKKVLFRSFVGVAPRLYRRAFLKDRELKNKQNGELQLHPPQWGTAWHLRTAGYVEIEAKLAKEQTSV
jgi:deoxycytidylate deaminase